MQRMEVCFASSARKMTFHHKISQSLEIVSNIERKFFDLKVRHRGSRPSISVRSFRSFTSALSAKTVDFSVAEAPQPEVMVTMLAELATSMS